MNDVALTGMSLITPFGTGRSAFWRGMLAGDTAVGRLTRFAVPSGAERLAAQIPPDACAEPVGERRAWLNSVVMDRALRAVELISLPAGALTVVAGQTPHCASPSAFARDYESPEQGGLEVQVPHACASTGFAMAFAREWLLSGNGDIAVVVGVVTLNPYDYESMDLVRAQSAEPARPLDVHRAGVNLGEGGGAVVLETVAHARARGRQPKILLSGAAGHVAEGVTDSSADAIAGCVLDAVEQTGSPAIDYVHAHATGTPQGDDAEVRGLSKVGDQLGWTGVPVSSHKGAIGHLLHASMMPGIAAAIGFLTTGTAPGTPGLRQPMTAERLTLLTGPVQPSRARSALVNGFGFFGNNAALVLTAESDRTT